MGYQSPAKSRFHFYLDQRFSMVCCAVFTKMAEPFMHFCMIATSGVHRTCCNVNVTAFIQNVIVHLTTFKSSFSTFFLILLRIIRLAHTVLYHTPRLGKYLTFYMN